MLRPQGPYLLSDVFTTTIHLADTSAAHLLKIFNVLDTDQDGRLTVSIVLVADDF